MTTATATSSPLARLAAAPARAWLRWVAFTSTREGALPMALCRIGVGATLALHFVGLLRSGAWHFLLVDPAFGGASGSADGALGKLVQSLGPVTPSLALGLCVAAIACALLVTAGAATRASLVGLYLSYRAAAELAGAGRGGYDWVITSALLLLLCSGAGGACSVDAVVRRRRGEAPLTSRRFLRLFGVGQLAIIYSIGALYKLSSGWVPGGPADALWYILHAPTWSRYGALPAWSFPITQVATTSTWLWELGGFLLLALVVVHESTGTGRRLTAVRRVVHRLHLRTAFLAFGVVLHLAIEALMVVGPFTPMMLSLYACCFTHDELRAAGAWVRERAAQLRR